MHHPLSVSNSVFKQGEYRMIIMPRCSFITITFPGPQHDKLRVGYIEAYSVHIYGWPYMRYNMPSAASNIGPCLAGAHSHDRSAQCHCFDSSEVKVAEVLAP